MCFFAVKDCIWYDYHCRDDNDSDDASDDDNDSDDASDDDNYIDHLFHKYKIQKLIIWNILCIFSLDSFSSDMWQLC